MPAGSAVVVINNQNTECLETCGEMTPFVWLMIAVLIILAIALLVAWWRGR